MIEVIQHFKIQLYYIYKQVFLGHRVGEFSFRGLFCSCTHMHTRAVKLAEKLNLNFFTKILSIFELHSNLKGINSVSKKKEAFGFSPEAPRAKYYQMHVSSK